MPPLLLHLRVLVADETSPYAKRFTQVRNPAGWKSQTKCSVCPRAANT
jgi:hypothetical protein